MRTAGTSKHLLALPLAVVLATALADDKTLSKEELAGKLNGVEPTDISDSPVPGPLSGRRGRVTSPTSRATVTTSSTATSTTRTRARTSPRRRARDARVAMLASVDPKSMIVFKPKNGEGQAHVTIFTDVDCGYCRQFHREIDKVTALGIEVHYLFFPRTGPNTESWEKAEQRLVRAPITTRRSRRPSSAATCPTRPAADTPVEMRTGRSASAIGVRGTPAMFSESGELIGGYLPPATLAKVLDESAADAPSAVAARSALTDGVDQLARGVGRARDAHAARDRPRRRQHHLHQHPRRPSAAGAARSAARMLGLVLAMGDADPAAVAAHLDHAAAGDAVHGVSTSDISGRDLILIGGGLFLIAKATLEIHESLEGRKARKARPVKHASFIAVHRSRSASSTSCSRSTP